MGGLRHVTTPDACAAAQGTEGYRPPPGGFLHLCTPEQLAFVLERHFAGRTGLLVLHLDAAALTEVRWEVSEPGMPPFPHLYSRLPASAVTLVEPFP